MKKLLFLTTVCILFCNCNGFKKIGSNLAEGVGTKSQDIGKNLVLGLDEGLSESNLRANLSKTIDSAIIIAGASANKNLKPVLDSLLSRRWSILVKQLVEDASGQQTRQNIEKLREALIGPKSTEELKLLIAAVLNDQNTGKVVALKDKLLGDETKTQVGALVDTAMDHLAKRFQSGITDSTLRKLSYFLDHDLHNSLDTNLSVIQKYATWFLVGIGAVAAFIITLVWLNRQKYLKLSTLLASQVNAIPDRQIYDQLTANIKQSAVTTGVEPALRKILDENHLLGEVSWKPVT
jgi:hypothetical protein